LIDAAQSAAHYPLDVQRLDCDFLVFSGHKLYGPTGTGVLFGKSTHLTNMQPWQVGGSMIREVDYTQSSYADAPSRFEAGTPHLAGVAGLGHAIEFIREHITEAVQNHFQQLTAYTEARLRHIAPIQLLGRPTNRSGIFSFVAPEVHPHDLATFLDSHQVAVRAGHHCTQPLMKHYGVPATVRVSLAPYNSREDIDQFVSALEETLAFFA
ncbi:MAG: aminotransferase class V-fold PLP-dependent enzyme, partial [Bacteroidota bacterium]